MAFEVSVVIPVYNAEKYLSKCVASAVCLAEVKEVILVEDKSPDNALQICRELEKENSKVKLYQHPNGENRGAGASRNLGIEKSSCDYIAFLDADDYYLPGRFDETARVFGQHPECDGVYEAIGYFREGQESKAKVYTIRKAIPPSQLFYYLLRGTYGHFSTIGLTVHKRIFSKAGMFDSTLRLHQDTELWLRIAWHGKIYAGNITIPVAMARRHGDNRISKADYKSRGQYWRKVKGYFKTRGIGILNRLLIDRKIARETSLETNRPFVVEFIKVIFQR
jgi:glycosyltransferase involved in cell wall biosynthesis